jgi:hypothetical protein
VIYSRTRCSLTYLDVQQNHHDPIQSLTRQDIISPDVGAPPRLMMVCAH